jgi:dienelactone hydrolase
MSLTVSCPGCGREYRVKDELAGKKIRCKDCDTVVVIPQADADDLGFDDDDLADAESAPALSPPSRKKSAAKKPAKKRKSSGGMSPAMKWTLGLLGGGLLVVTLCCGGVFLAGWRAVGQLTAGVPVPAGQSFEQFRSGFRTKLVKVGPSPQGYDIESPPENVTEIQYPSGPLSLKAWVYRPPGVEEPRPALVFFHGGFAFGGEDLMESCRPAIDAGYVVMGPMLRGENGNPGNFELFLGEIDDARAACQWLAQQPYVDRSRIYTFGHSVGGGVSAVLSLLDDVPIQHGGSSGGLYGHITFLGWNDIVPFENTPRERSARLLVGNAHLMRRPHYGYLGTEDDAFHDTMNALQKEATNDLLTMELVPGDHFTSFDESLRRYLRVVEGK